MSADRCTWKCPGCGSTPTVLVLDGGSALCSDEKCKISTYHMCKVTSKYETDHGPLSCMATKREKEGKVPMIHEFRLKIDDEKEAELFDNLKEDWRGGLRETIVEMYSEDGYFESLTGKEIPDVDAAERKRIGNFVANVLGLALDVKKKGKEKEEEESLHLTTARGKKRRLHSE